MRTLDRKRICQGFVLFRSGFAADVSAIVEDRREGFCEFSVGQTVLVDAEPTEERLVELPTDGVAGSRIRLMAVFGEIDGRLNVGFDVDCPDVEGCYAFGKSC